ncbi:hypothetical protein KP509_02G097900 [Ceratopteris richardii]|uniref:Uncharacterized protein n=1 Tax=Ceratopteris richardii TaxID=49495 RepID=A0A8T2VH59_CERRI|nr:hypothetical protein KP509_02G097900 [Ceratopteris richardii]
MADSAPTMAISASSETPLVHDSHYGPDLLGFQWGSGRRLFATSGRSGGRSRGATQFDDFSVSAHLHMLRPQSLVLHSTAAVSVQRAVENRIPNPAVFRRTETTSASTSPQFPSQTEKSCLEKA